MLWSTVPSAHGGNQARLNMGARLKYEKGFIGIQDQKKQN
jgi:hypothetical protein